MAKAKALDIRRKAIRNIRKITRTMELIATARFKRAMDRATAASAYTDRITELARDLSESGLEVSHPLLEGREKTERAILLALTSNRGLCSGYNAGVLRASLRRWNEWQQEAIDEPQIEVSGKRGISALKFRGIATQETFTHFEDKPTFEEVEVLANRYLEAYIAGKLDRLDVTYTRFFSVSKQVPVVETLLPLGQLGGADEPSTGGGQTGGESMYEFLPSAESILEEVVPTSFKIRLFKCFLDAAVSEQIARMVAMKSATESADKMIKQLSMMYNRARQTQITSELMDLIGGVEALAG